MDFVNGFLKFLYLFFGLAAVPYLLPLRFMMAQGMITEDMMAYIFLAVFVAVIVAAYMKKPVDFMAGFDKKTTKGKIMSVLITFALMCIVGVIFEMLGIPLD